MTNTTSAARFYTAAELRASLKSELGLNARKVSVRTDGYRYMVIIVRDATVDVKAVEAFAKARDSWSMDMHDISEGQSVRVETTDEVETIRCGPFMEEATEMLAQLAALGHDSRQCVNARNGVLIWLSGPHTVVAQGEGLRSRDIGNPHPRTARALARFMAEV